MCPYMTYLPVLYDIPLIIVSGLEMSLISGNDASLIKLGSLKDLLFLRIVSYGPRKAKLLSI